MSQFHFGSIQTSFPVGLQEKIYDNVSIPLWFNSNKGFFRVEISIGRKLSQFHFGSIQTLEEKRFFPSGDFNWSQFHFGSIQTIN